LGKIYNEHFVVYEVTAELSFYF